MNLAGDIMADSHDESKVVDSAANSGERTYALFNHLVGLVSVASGGLPLGGLLGTLIMWRIRHKDSPFLDDHGRESVNFQLSLLTYAVGGAIALGILTAITFGVGGLLFLPGVIALFVLNLYGCVKGAIAANRGEFYRYPMNIRYIADPSPGV